MSLLVSRAGRAVTRTEIQAALWTENVHVDFEGGINFCVRQFRKALDDSAASPRFIETLPRHGYRFVAKVTRARARSIRSALRVRWQVAAALFIGAAIGSAVPPCVHDRAVDGFHRFFNIKPENCLFNRLGS